MVRQKPRQWKNLRTNGSFKGKNENKLNPKFRDQDKQKINYDYSKKVFQFFCPQCLYQTNEFKKKCPKCMGGRLKKTMKNELFGRILKQ